MCIVGSLHVEHVVRAERFPRPGETVQGTEFTSAPGGKGAVQAVAAARSGADVAMIGRVGRDEAGRVLRATLQRERIDLVGLAESWSVPTGVAIVTADPRGDVCTVAVPGANGALEPGDLDEARARIKGAGVMVISFEVPEAAVIRAAEHARANGTATILNPAPARAIPAGLVPLIDVLVLNAHEALCLTGLDADHGASLEDALAGMGFPAVVLTRGRLGSMLVRGSSRRHFPVHEVKVVDTLGAGDSAIGVLAAAWAGTAEPGVRPDVAHLDEPMRRSAAAGSLATTRRGTIPGVPSASEIDVLLAGGVPADERHAG